MKSVPHGVINQSYKARNIRIIPNPNNSVRKQMGKFLYQNPSRHLIFSKFLCQRLSSWFEIVQIMEPVAQMVRIMTLLACAEKPPRRRHPLGLREESLSESETPTRR